MKTARSFNLAESRVPRRLQARRGYSLGELLIVLAVLTALAGLSWPTVRGSLAKNRLQDSARRVRTELAKTRLKAIQTGVPHRFRFELDGSQFKVDRRTHAVRLQRTPAQFADRTGLPSAGIDISQPETALASARPIASATHSLPVGVRFAGVMSARPMPVSTDQRIGKRSIEVQRDGDSDDTVTELSPVLWSAPIIFYPDGRTRNANIRLIGDRGFRIDVKLRGLTGTATVSELQRTVEPKAVFAPELDEDSA